MRAAARLATGETGSAAADKQQFGFAYTTFVRERKLSPDFDLACREALEEALGKIEEALYERTSLPTERATLDKNGNIVHISKDFRNADALSLAILRHADDSWIEKREVKSDVTVNRGGSSQRTGVNISFEDMKLLDDSERDQLSNLLRAMLERKERQQAALPSPEMEQPNEPA